MFETIKKAYHVRSTIVHGEYIKNKESDLIEISQKLDDILRRILVEHKLDFDNKELNLILIFELKQKRTI